MGQALSGDVGMWGWGQWEGPSGWRVVWVCMGDRGRHLGSGCRGMLENSM